jgi:predicted GNAT family acetyltransferase
VSTPEVVHQPERLRFAAAADGHEAVLTYRRRGSVIELVHTGVPDALAGRGLGGRLVAAAVAFAADEGLTVVPTCPFARARLTGHPGEAATVTVEWGPGAPGPG